MNDGVNGSWIILRAVVGISVSVASPRALLGQAHSPRVVIAPIDWQPRTPTDSTFASDLTKAIHAAIAESLDVGDVQVVSAYNWERSKDSGQSYRNDRYRKQGYQYLVW